MDMINVKINGRDYSVPAESTVLEAVRADLLPHAYIPQTKAWKY